MESASTTMLIPLPGGMCATIDCADYELVSRYRWQVKEKVLGTRSIWYAQSHTHSGRSVRMHRLILGVEAGEIVDHRNGDGLDNRRSNIRVCTPQQNQFNKRVNCNNLVGIKGVGPAGNGKWRARATLNYKTITLGVFATPLEASKAYQEFAERVHGEFYCAG